MRPSPNPRRAIKPVSASQRLNREARPIFASNGPSNLLGEHRWHIDTGDVVGPAVPSGRDRDPLLLEELRDGVGERVHPEMSGFDVRSPSGNTKAWNRVGPSYRSTESARELQMASAEPSSLVSSARAHTSCALARPVKTTRRIDHDQPDSEILDARQTRPGLPGC